MDVGVFEGQNRMKSVLLLLLVLVTVHCQEYPAGARDELLSFPEAQKTMVNLLNQLNQQAGVLGLLPNSVKVSLAKEQIARNPKAFEQFRSMSKQSQERMLGRLLAGNRSARDIFAKNRGIIRELGFGFDINRVLDIARTGEQKKDL